MLICSELTYNNHYRIQSNKPFYLRRRPYTVNTRDSYFTSDSYFGDDRAMLGYMRKIRKILL